MFCVYHDDAVQKLFRGEYKAPDGSTYPAAWLRSVSISQRASINVYYFTDNSKRGYDKEFYSMGAISDAAPDVNGEVIRTSTPVERNTDAVKRMVKNRVTVMRGQVAHDGVVFSTKNFATDTTTVESINLIATALLDGATFPGGTLPWDTMDTPQAPTQTFNATEAQFKSLRNAVAAHFVLSTNNARTHLTAIDALTTHAELLAYDISTGWPTNPDTSEAE